MDNQSMALTAAQHLMPAMQMEQVIERRNTLVRFVEKAMVRDVDFGVIPGTGPKPVLLKPGAEKLITLFGLTPRFAIVESTLDWTGKDHDGEPFFSFIYRCSLYHGDWLIAEADGSCNSMEKKYRWRWVPANEIPEDLDKSKLKTQGGATTEFAFAIERAETTGQYGKPAAYWKQFQDAINNGTARPVSKKTRNNKVMEAWEIDTTLYRVPNTDIPDQVNTIQKMAQKRSLVAATVIAVNASEFFTQDLEDMVIDGDYRVMRENEAIPAPKFAAEVAKPTVPAANQPQPDWIEEQIKETEQVAQPAQAAPVPQPAQSAPAQNGNGGPIPWPAPLRTGYNAGYKFQTEDGRKKVVGVVAGTMDELAGDTDRRHTVLLAWFGVQSTRDLPDAKVKALASFITHPQARSMIEQAIAEYLKYKGQQTLPMEPAL